MNDLVSRIGTWGTAFAGVCGLCSAVGGAVTYGMTFKQDVAVANELSARVSALEAQQRKPKRDGSSQGGMQAERRFAGSLDPRGPQGKQSSPCVNSEQVKQAKSIVVKADIEFCNNDGNLLTKVINVSENNGGSVQFFDTAFGNWSCGNGGSCSFIWLNNRRYFVIEKVFDKDGAKVALLRFEDQ